MYNVSYFWKHNEKNERKRERGRKSWVGSWTALSKSCIKYGCCAWEIATDGGRVGNRYGNSAPMSTTLVTSHHIIKRESGCRPPHPCCLPRLLSIFNSSAALWGFLHFYRAEREKTTHVTSCRESWWCRKRGAKERNGDTYKPKCVCVSTCQDSAVEEMGQSDLWLM